jgi:gamma-glutamylcyclotransferase (GGCT)/AIG2-like uncharacterized protein YtfP
MKARECGTPAAGWHLFVYGSLVDPERLEQVLGRRHGGERLAARLDGFQRVASAWYPFPYIVKAAGERVDGVLLMDLWPNDVAALDAYEEVAQGMYRRQDVHVQAWGCGSRPIRLPAQAYVAGPRLLASTAR